MPLSLPRLVPALMIFTTLMAGGCKTDMVVSPLLKDIEPKQVYVTEFTSEDPGIGHVLRDVLIKELLRDGVHMTTQDKASLIVTGAAFLTDRSKGRSGIFTSSSVSTQAIESISVVVRTPDGTVMASASYDNGDHDTASEIGKKLGAKLAAELTD